jgi:hypothetical protein
VNHLRRDLHRGFAGDEDNASPVALPHSGDVMAAQPNAAQHVGLEEAEPVGIADLLERLGLEDPEIVDQDVHQRKLPHQLGASCRPTEISSDALHLRSGHLALQLFYRLAHPLRRAAVDGDPRPFRGKRACRGETDPGGGAGHQRAFAVQPQVHTILSR